MNRRPHFDRRRAFIDTSAFFAATDNRERDHDAAQSIMDHLAAERWRLFTSNFVLAETHALTIARLGPRIAARVLFEVDQSGITVVRINVRDERRAREIIRQYDDKSFSLTDATSFSVMERLDITTARSFDRDFAQFGFTLLTA
jgi:predicted nucleic acid-binding protein